MEKNLILTCDAGTTGCKCTVFNVDGDALSSVKRNYNTIYPQPNQAEQDPDAILSAVFDGIRELLQQVPASRIACVGLSGTMNGCIPTDENGHALCNNIIHSDCRSGVEAEELLSHIPADEFYRLTGNRAGSQFTLPKIMWVKKHLPEIWKRTRWIMNIKDYLYGHLTGRFGYTDYSDASLTIALDITRKKWASDLLKDLGIDETRMPTILPGHDMHGRITREVYYQTGLICGTPVAVGGGDGACTARGAGVGKAGSAYCYIGSSAWVSQLLDSPVLDKQARVFNYLDMNGEQCHLCGQVQTGAAAFDWALKNLLGAEGKCADISIVENMARQIQPGADGVLFLPTLMGWRTPYWDPNTRGCLMGFSLYHDRRHIARAIYEGIAFALNACVEVMNDCNVPMNSMMLAGGGARSGLWPDVLAAVFDMTTNVHMNPGETTSLGAAMAAGVGAGLFESYEHAAALVKSRSTHTPNTQWVDAYKKVYPIYADIYEHIRPLNNRIAAL